MPLQATSGAASYDAFGGGVAAVPTYIEDVFSTYLYTGNGSTQTITNGIDLSTKGGLVWTKGRSAITDNMWFDTARGVQKELSSNKTNAEATNTLGITAFGTTGYSMGSDGSLNGSGTTYASWTFRKQPKFFDVVTYTGNGLSGRTVAHSLGSVPGCIIVKNLSNTTRWLVYHKDVSTGYLVLNETSVPTSSWGAIYNVTSTNFAVDNGQTLNGNGQNYVAYIFAHNAGGFGLTGTDNVISCGSWTSAGSTPVSVNLGYEPQWILWKRTSSTGNWYLNDNMRGMPVQNGAGTGCKFLYPNLSDAEYGDYGMDPTSTGFNAISGASGNTFIYIAIRRGPMKVPTSGTSVFSPIARAGTSATANVSTGFVTDAAIIKIRSGGFVAEMYDRLRGANKRLYPDQTSAESTTTDHLTSFATNDGYTLGASASGEVNLSGYNYANWNFRRAPSFFDEVCYTGTGSATTVTHNLGVAPEMIIVKRRNTALNWVVYQQNAIKSGSTAALSYLILNDTAAVNGPWAGYWNSTAPTSSVFSVGTDSWTNASGGTYVAYLFATCAGVSKVGSYTGNGSSQTINCGFTGGARFVLIKRTDSTGDWYVWDTARGIVTANDPHLSLNTTAAEVTTDDTIDTDSTGFVVNQVTATNVNVTSATYIFLAIA